jgi:hypothetical protein
MMRKSYFIIKIFLAFLAFIPFSCDESSDYYSGYEQSIIVDGKIEMNNYPKVILTRNIPYYVEVDSADLLYLVLRQAKVTVSDGELSEILTIKFNRDEFPPYYYEGNELTGKAGRTYYLTIEYGDIKLTATTTIPEPVSPDSVWFQPNAPGDTLGKINARLADNKDIHSYYRTYTMIRSRQNDFYPTLISLFDDRLFNGTNYTFHLSKGPESFLNLNNTSPDYESGDTVLLKIATMDEACFKFWQGYQTEVVNGANPFASSFHKIESNIVGEGKGIWAGYGISINQIINK